MEAEKFHVVLSARGKTQESQWYNLIQIQRPGNKDSQSFKTEEDGCSNSSKVQICPPLPFCSIQNLNRLDDVYMH